jgi:CubicO group peptidase (beta-lactamase class C family)
MTELTNKFDAVDALFSEWNKPDSPGCAIAIIHRGHPLYRRGYGMANLEHAIPITEKSVFDIGSISKQFVAMCIALLARQGKLSLDDEIQKYIPELRNYEYPITIRHLIHHTSGLRDYLTLMDLAGLRFENEYPDEEIIGLIARQKALNFRPGEEFLYCNSGYLLLAEIIKKSSGLSLRAFADESIFAPLEMKNTFFHDDFSEIVKNRAVGYSPVESGGFRINMSIFDVVGDGGVHSTIEDLCLWDANFYHNIIGGYGQHLIEDITSPGKLNSGKALDYAFGIGISTYRGLKTIGHGGAWMGYRSEMTCFPEQQFSVICLSNTIIVNLNRLVMQISEIFLAEEFTAPEAKNPESQQQFIEIESSEMEAKNGFYRNVKSGAIWKLAAQSGGLMVEVSEMRFKITPTSLRHYRSVDIPFEICVEFQIHPQPSPVLMYVRIEGGQRYVLEKIDTVPLDTEQLADYSGYYYSEELCRHFQFLKECDSLILNRKNSKREHLEVVSRDLFKGVFHSFEFIRNENNEIEGFNLGTERVKNIHFVKQ